MAKTTKTRKGFGTGAGRETKLNASARKRFLDTLLATNNVNKACRAGGASHTAWYKLRYNDPEFAAQWDHVKDQIVHNLEDIAYRRAVEGEPEPVYYQGEVIDYVYKVDNTLVKFLLSSYRPAVYRQRHEVTGKDGKDLLNEFAQAVGSVTGGEDGGSS